MLVRLKGLSKASQVALIAAFIGLFGVLIQTFGPMLFENWKEHEDNDITITGPAEKIFDLIKQNTVSNAPSSPAETQTLKKVITRLAKSQDAQKQHIVATLEQGDFDAAITQFEALDQEQSRHTTQQVDQIVATKRELAALLTYHNPDKSKRLLAEAIKLAPNDLQARSQHDLILMRMGLMPAAIDTF